VLYCSTKKITKFCWEILSLTLLCMQTLDKSLSKKIKNYKIPRKKLKVVSSLTFLSSTLVKEANLLQTKCQIFSLGKTKKNHNQRRENRKLQEMIVRRSRSLKRKRKVKQNWSHKASQNKAMMQKQTWSKNKISNMHQKPNHKNRKDKIKI
jgi:hypothetical protein